MKVTLGNRTLCHIIGLMTTLSIRAYVTVYLQRASTVLPVIILLAAVGDAYLGPGNAMAAMTAETTVMSSDANQPVSTR